MKKLVAVGAIVVVSVVGCSGGGPPPDGYATSSSAIQGGTNDTSDGFAVGVVQLAPGGGVAFCSGVLLAPNLVATARHCVSQLASTQINCATSRFSGTLPAGDIFVTPDARITQTSNFIGVVGADGGASGIVVPTPTGVCGNDLALLILSQPIPLPQYVTPTINPPMTDHQLYTTAITAIGYGVDTPTDTQGTSAGVRRIRENINLICIPNDPTPADCYSDPNLRNIISPNEFEGGDGTCEGDSGSGAFDQGSFNSGKWVAFGVLSRGGQDVDAGLCLGSIYTRFDAWGPLVTATAMQAASIGGYSPPSWATGQPSMTPDASQPPPQSADAAADEGGVSSVTDAGTPAPACLSNGATCGATSDCCSLNCLAHGNNAFACEACSVSNPCDNGYGCQKGVCVLGATSDYGDAGAPASGGVRASSLCTVGALGSAPRGAGRTAIGAAVAAAFCLRRRNRAKRS